MEQKNEKGGFSRRKALQVVISILVAIAVWVYVDVEKAPDRTKTIRGHPRRVLRRVHHTGGQEPDAPVRL